MDFARRRSGLTEAEATLLLAQVGPNVIRTDKFAGSFTSSPKRCASRHSSCFLSLAAFIFVLGNLGEGLFVCASAVVSLGMVILQETRSERALQALQALAEPEARVIRDGRQRRIPSRELVPDDIMLDNGG